MEWELRLTPHHALRVIGIVVYFDIGMLQYVVYFTAEKAHIIVGKG